MKKSEMRNRATMIVDYTFENLCVSVNENKCSVAEVHYERLQGSLTAFQMLEVLPREECAFIRIAAREVFKKLAI